ncbi:MAG: hypothetical protein ACXVLQ_17795 [Bacteriovorax sp.]
MRLPLLVAIFLCLKVVNTAYSNECNQAIHNLLNAEISANEIKKERFSLKAQGEDINLPLMSTGDKVTYTYHWTKNRNYLDEQMAQSGLKKELADLNVENVPLKDGNAAGKGLYVAPNALMTSYGYGDVLIEVPIREGSEFGAEESEAVINSHLSGLVYDFLRGKKNAAVIRSESAVNLEGIKSFDGGLKLGATLNDYEAYAGASWEGAMLHYPGLFMASGRSYQKIISRGFDDKAEILAAGKKLLNEKGEATDLGVAMILLGELQNLRPSPVALEELKKSASDFNPYEEALGRYIDRFYNSARDILFSETPNKQNSFLVWNDSYANLKEIGWLPADWSEKSSVTETRAYLIKSAKERVPNDLIVAYLKSLSLLVDESEKSNSFIQRWPMVKP